VFGTPEVDLDALIAATARAAVADHR